MPYSIKDQLTDDLQKAKTAGKTRATRIKEIFQTATTAAVTEIKTGSEEVRSIAKDTVQSVMGNIHDDLDAQLHQNLTETQPDTSASPTPVSLKSLLTKLFRLVRLKFSTRLQQEYNDLPRQYDDLKQQATKLDAKLTDRYGDRYDQAKAQAKQRFHKVKVWYNQKRSAGEALNSSVLEQKQSEFTTAIADAGTAIAQKEQQIQQQVKEFVRSATSER